MTTEGTKTYAFDYNNRLIQSTMPGSTPTTSTFILQLEMVLFFITLLLRGQPHMMRSQVRQQVTLSTTFNVNSAKDAISQYLLERAFVPFNTASLPDNATVSNATLKLLLIQNLMN